MIAEMKNGLDMKKYRLDEDPNKPVWDVEEDLTERGNRPTSVWVEEIVTIFGETHYTENYRLISRRRIRKMGLLWS